ncbi:MAG: DUF1015 family protein [Chloroflexota bacterium]
MPTLRPFRALRFNASVTDLSAVLAPPYDIISQEERLALLAQDPHNAVRIDLPADVGSGVAADYAAAARTVADWRRDGVLRKDDEPTITVHEMAWADADGRPVTSTGFVVRLKLEEFGPDSGVLPHERTLSGPRKDRYDLLAATRLNSSPLVFLAGSDGPATTKLVKQLSDRPADAEATTADGVSHRLWICNGSEETVVTLLGLVAAAPITIADGHHRYETALQYQRDRAARGSTDGDPAWQYVMALVYSMDEAPPALPTHRVVRGGPGGADLLEQLGPFVSVQRLASREALLGRMAEPVDVARGATGSGRIGLLSSDQAAILEVRSDRVDALLDAALSDASKGLDVNALTAIVERVYGADPDALVGEGRLSYVKGADEATQLVCDGEADTCFLLDPMPATAISRVAEAGEVMPQKSTYFNPKAPTGLLFSPLEW